MERIHMNDIRDIIYRLEKGESIRAIHRDTGYARKTIRKYRDIFQEQGLLGEDSSCTRTADMHAFLGHPLLRLYSKPIVTATDKEDIPMVSSLSQNYPNTFNPVTTIRFSSSREGNVELKIYDVQGRRVSVLVDKEMQAGPHRVN